MNKKLLFTVIGILVVITGAVTYVVATPNKGTIAEEMTIAPTEESPVTAKETPVTEEVAVTPQAAAEPAKAEVKPGVYTDYSESAIATTSGTKLLFFHAPWCSQCRQMEASINKDGIPTDVTVFKVDYDSNQKLREKYGVTLQTTFVKIDDSGNKIKSYVSYEEPRFSAVQRELL
jgi:thiol-disulfide isomerase/thioredoxin